MASSNPLSPSSLLSHMAAALPSHAKADTSSDLSSSHEALALFTHAVMVSLGFRLLGFSEDHPLEAECQRLAPRLPPTWNSGSHSSISFLYAHPQSAMRFVVRVDRLGGKIEIRGLGVGDERIHRVEITAREYVSNAALPVRIGLNADGEEVEGRGDLEDKLGRVFIDKERMTDLANLLKVQIIQRLIPALQKEGYQESNNPDDLAAASDADRSGRVGPQPQPQFPGALPQPAQPHPYPRDPTADPLAGPRRPPVPAGDFPPPDFEDEYEINRPPRGAGRPLGPFGEAGRSPLNIGHDDLNPPGLGPHDPLRPSFAGGLGGGLPRPGGMGGGMHPTFDDPLFQGPGGQGGQGGFDPQAPPGARWDPIGPGGAPRFGGGRPGRGGPGAFGGGSLGPFGGNGGGSGGGFGGFGSGDII